MEALRTEHTRPFDEIADRARRALDEAARRGIPPDPKVFEIFYAYLEGENPELVAAVDSLLAGSGGVSLDAVERLHEAYFGLADRTGRFMAVGEQLERELGELGHAMSRRAQSDSDYLGRLIAARDGLSILSRPGAVRRTVRELIEITQSHSEEAEAFTSQLETARAQIRDLQAELRELRESAYRDHLTGLANRRRLDIVLEYETASRPVRGAFSVVVCDLDRFKRINDGFGHPVGDSVLQQFARIMRENVQGKDTAGRLGGEEFLIILPETELLGARHVAERIRQLLAARSFVVSGTRNRIGAVTASFGVAEHGAGETAQELLERADRALYLAKSKGRNRVVAASA
jgi:diguanylate cyclase